jgi:small subunit ribosomal protein S7
VPKRELRPDPIHGAPLVTQLVNKIMLDGKKSLAERIVYQALEQLQTRSGMEPVAGLKKAVDNARPMLEVKSRRVGGATYPVPIEVPARRGTSLAIRWIVGVARDRKGKGMAEKLSAELLDALQGTGAAVKKKEDLHRQAEANRAFAHYRW